MRTRFTLEEVAKMTPWFRRQVFGSNSDAIPSHLRHATNLTMFGQRNYNNNRNASAVNRESAIRAVRQQEAESVVLSSAQ